MKELEAGRAFELSRNTKETDIFVGLNIDGSGSCEADTGIPFMDHMLEQFSRHSGFDLVVKAKGDVRVDMHHTIEDVGIVLGKVFLLCLGQKEGIRRYGSTVLPMDDSLCMAAADLCGRANLVYNCGAVKGCTGEFDTGNIKEFFKAFTSNSMTTLHINLLYGENLHHNAECIFKAAARALKEAVLWEGTDIIPSTKGCI